MRMFFCEQIFLNFSSFCRFYITLSVMTTPNDRKRKRQTITLEEKQSIIEVSKTKPKTSDLVSHFNNKYGESAIRNILNSKDKIQEAIDNGAGGKRATLKGAKNSNLDEALLKWLKDVRSENVAVDGPTLKASFDFSDSYCLII
jgi:hypothetical protein